MRAYWSDGPHLSAKAVQTEKMSTKTHDSPDPMNSVKRSRVWIADADVRYLYLFRRSDASLGGSGAVLQKHDRSRGRRQLRNWVAPGDHSVPGENPQDCLTGTRFPALLRRHGACAANKLLRNQTSKASILSNRCASVQSIIGFRIDLRSRTPGGSSPTHNLPIAKA